MDKTMWHPENEDDEGLDPRLMAQVAALPTDLEPPRDLWPAIAARLEPRSPASGDQAPADRRWISGWARQALAALLSAAVGAVITWMSLGGGALGGGALGGGREASPGPGPAPDAQAAPASYQPAAEKGDDYRLVEADYLRAKEALWVSVYARRDQFSAETLDAVEKNFAIIDRAIYDLRQALDQDPGNPRLEHELYRNHRRGLDLLRRLADST